MVVDDVNAHPLDKELAVEAIRYNGYVPNSNGLWITYNVQGEHYAINVERFPRMGHLYNEMEGKQKARLSVFPQLGMNAPGDKKVLS